MATLTSSPNGRKKLPAIDMTPMVDLAFLLLTFFVLTTTLTDSFVVKLNMPEKDPVHQPPIKADKVLTLVLGEQNKIHWYIGTASEQAETTDFSANGIRKVLLNKKSTIKGLHVFIKPSSKSQYKDLINILDEMIITEIERYAIVEMETQDEQLIAMN